MARRRLRSVLLSVQRCAKPDTLLTSCVGKCGYLRCGVIPNFTFNFKNNRFLEVYTVAYVKWRKTRKATHFSVSGGTCTKIP